MKVSLQLTAVQLRVPNLARSIAYYSSRLGFAVTDRDGPHASLATAPEAEPSLTLLEDRAAARAAPDAAGLFHAALLLPSRSALGAWLRRAEAHKVDLEGFADHGVSEALYLSDPDGNGLEFYVDRPRNLWPFADHELAMTTRPLDLRSLLAASAPAGAAPLTGAHWGHLHLRVTQLERSEAFYRSTLGVDVTQRSLPGARFLAADGYHHHLGLNTWGSPRNPQRPGSLGLMEATFTRSVVAAETVHSDPDGIRIRVGPMAAPAKIP